MALELYPFAVSVQGASHKKREEKAAASGEVRGFPCQDRSYSKLEKADALHRTPFYLSAACDGHGGAAYFRSGTGAGFAISVMREAVCARIDSIAALSDKEIPQALHSLISEIVSAWHKKVSADLTQNPVTETEYRYLEADDKAAANRYREGKDLHSIYGSTALCFVLTEKLWFALQIGDGDVVLVEDGKFSKPVPEDKSLFLNQTTSLCDDNAEAEFRIAFGRTNPEAAFCSTDGLANCFNGDKPFFDFYGKILWLFRDWDGGEAEGEKKASLLERLNESLHLPNIALRVQKAKEDLVSSLPDISKRGSGDDMSIAGFVGIDPKRVQEHLKAQSLVQDGLKFLERGKTNEAAEAFKKAGENGYPEGYLQLGILWEKSYNAIHEKAALDSAVKYLSLATQGTKEAKAPLAALLTARALEAQKAGEHKAAFADYEKAAEYENAQAQYALSLYYGRPQDYPDFGVKQNIARALEWTQKAAAQGHAAAECKMGKCYRDGRGVQKDAELSLEWYRKAASHGSEEARAELAKLEKSAASAQPTTVSAPKTATQVQPAATTPVHTAPASAQPGANTQTLEMKRAEQAYGRFADIKKNSVKAVTAVFLAVIFILTGMMAFRHFKATPVKKDELKTEKSPVMPKVPVQELSVLKLSAPEPKEEPEKIRRLCRNCGAEVPDGANFCPNCGEKVVADDIETMLDAAPEKVESDTNAKIQENENELENMKEITNDEI